MKITLKYWSHTCADGCCFIWGYEVFVDEKKIGSTQSGDAQELVDLLNEFLSNDK